MEPKCDTCGYGYSAHGYMGQKHKDACDHFYQAPDDTNGEPMTEPEELPTGFPPAVGSDIESLTVALAPLMRRAKWLRATMAANEAAKAEELKAVVDEIDQRHAAVQQANQMRLDSLMREIERLGRMRLEYEGDRKSVILLHGQIGTRKQPTKVEIENQDEVLAALGRRGIAPPWNPGPKPPAPTLNKATLLKLAKQHNTEFPGMKLVLGEDRFFFDEKVVDDAEPV